MNPEEFVKSIYLGDRLCLSVSIDGVERRLAIKVDCISRVRGKSWDYYTEEDLYGGLLVFEDVRSCDFNLDGILPNDWIEIVSLDRINTNEPLWEIVLSFGKVDRQGISSEAMMKIVFGKIFIETSDGLKIND